MLIKRDKSLGGSQILSFNGASTFVLPTMHLTTPFKFPSLHFKSNSERQNSQYRSCLHCIIAKKSFSRLTTDNTISVSDALKKFLTRHFHKFMSLEKV